MSAVATRFFFTVRDVREAHQGVGRHFFDRDTMRFFRSRICAQGRVYGGRFFVTSEKKCFDDYRRVYQVREVTPDGADIETRGQYGSVGAAITAAKRMSKALPS